jgi:hypothetical protein
VEGIYYCTYLTVVVVDEYHCYQLHTKLYPTCSVKVNSVRRVINVDFDVIDQLLIKCSAFMHNSFTMCRPMF